MSYCKCCFILFLFFLTGHGLKAQPEISKAHLEAIAKLDFLVGDWQGKGWMITQGGQKVLFEQTEKIQWKLDQSVLLIEGMGESNGKVIHNALAIISYDPEQGTFNLRSHLANGRKGDYRAELQGEKQLIWHLEIPGKTIRYTMGLNDKGHWYEIGEFQTGEDSWYKFFETTLERM